jgi:hypothetical protein
MKRRKALALLCGAGIGSTITTTSSFGASKRVRILVDLPDDRDNTGVLRLVDATGKKLAGPYPVFGRSDQATAEKHGNKSRDPLMPFGNTPTGEFQVPRAFSVGDGTNYKASSYGPRAAFVLNPSGGQALLAKKNGRVGLLIHGGALGAHGRLRATHGCLRMKNEHLEELLVAIQVLMSDPVHLRCEVVELAASIGGPGDPVSGEDLGDPPTGIQGLLSGSLPDGVIVLPKP